MYQGDSRHGPAGIVNLRFSHGYEQTWVRGHGNNRTSRRIPASHAQPLPAHTNHICSKMPSVQEKFNTEAATLSCQDWKLGKNREISTAGELFPNTRDQAAPAQGHDRETARGQEITTGYQTSFQIPSNSVLLDFCASKDQISSGKSSPGPDKAVE
ncbi:hypothetical protein SKAU_G00184840 [Synaphobranchus kaupii]|uniref:Uncharacterized protein n=1 Tax=Synaphobranchus kaupii TaxID=118154 RepID=A0A9Q1IWV0_SYNKA|nr:hypothetical protein SKAU_G00184840 [Synaphobranchus kaupii]